MHTLIGSNNRPSIGERYELDQIGGKRKQFKGSAKQRWTKLTDDDLDYISGTRDKFVGKLQERYGIGKEDAERRPDEWLSTQGDQERL
jgi:uncharacterized protein YjbJ (UPF0337 family)